MTNPRRPYRSFDHTLPLQRGPGQPLGFIRTVQGKIAQLIKEVAGLEDRLKYRYGQDTGDPHAYKNDVLFVADPNEVPFDVGDGTLVRRVIPDGRLLSIPIVIEGPGVFVARYLCVTVYQFVSGSTGQRYAVPLGKSYLPPSVGGAVDTLKFGLNFGFGLPGLSIYGNDRNIGLNFFWNLIDRDSERRLADGLISQQALLPGGFQNQVDGNLFEFPVPWLFERAGMLEFQFQPVIPLLEDSTAPQAALVRVEVHGTKFITERDALLREAV